MRHVISVLLVTLLVSSCGGGGGGSTVPPSPGGTAPPPDPNPFSISDAEAVRFLRQATFGPTADSITRLKQTGYEGWIDEQILLPPSLELPYMDSQPEPEEFFELHTTRMDAWFQHAVTGSDQLRQRMAFALSEIMVISQLSVLARTPRGLADYYDVLIRHAFGNYRELMEKVTLHPAMGVYLSMLGNEKPDPERNIRPDENYARELMQLFTIGLVELNPDGSPRLDAGGNEIPTYDQGIIEGFAHVYTGWTFGGSSSFHSPSFLFTIPMQSFPEFHDTGEKRLLNGVVLPTGQSPEKDLADALDNIFFHDNVPPFVSLRLIQRLVTANPSPDYIERVAGVFRDDGTGQRGNLGAVVKAILLDDEARQPASDDTAGKLVEPIIRLTGLWRAFDAKARNGRFLFAAPEFFFSQAPLRAPSVFNFFTPFYSPPGELRSLGLVSPEMQITNETSTANVNNYLAVSTFLRNSSSPDLEDSEVFIDIESELELAADPGALVDRVADRLLAGRISSALHDEAAGMVGLIPEDEPAFRVAEAIHAIVTSPEYAYLR